MNAHYFTVSAGDVIAHCCVSEHKYIVYKKNGRIYVNAMYRVTGQWYECCIHYDRWLCDDMEAYKKLTKEDIDSQGYGAYMDGAR